MSEKCIPDIDMQIGWIQAEIKKTQNAIVYYDEKIPHMVEQFEEVEAYLKAILDTLKLHKIIWQKNQL